MQNPTGALCRATTYPTDGCRTVGPARRPRRTVISFRLGVKWRWVGEKRGVRAACAPAARSGMGLKLKAQSLQRTCALSFSPMPTALPFKRLAIKPDAWGEKGWWPGNVVARYG